MSPLQLPGKSFGHLRDLRNYYCLNCGDGFREYLLKQDTLEKEKGDVKLLCPYCDYYIKTIPISRVEKL